jgi:hypothetical protein
VRTLFQSKPTVPPLIQFPFSEIGFSVSGKLVVYVLMGAAELS